MAAFPKSGILVEAEAFDSYGGWTLDSQFEMEMGSPYLLAHGNGRPVEDATTTIQIPKAGQYNIWVRAKDWVPGHHPGRFTLTVNDTTLATEFGTNDKDWSWQLGGRIQLAAGNAKLKLHDLTGFCGRCDAIFLSKDDTRPPEGWAEDVQAWRRQLRGLPDKPTEAGNFDVVVVGGGVPGVAATLTAARLGNRVALIHNRPVLGGNASTEIGLRPRGIHGPVVEEITDRHENGDLHALKVLDVEPNAVVFLEYTAYETVTDGSTIVSVDARHASSGRELRFAAPVFIDCSGKAILGLLSGAQTLFGQEPRAAYNESLAPVLGDSMHHGNTVFFRTRTADSPVFFPSVPWATEVAKDYANLGGQLQKPGIDNGEGPSIIPNETVSEETFQRRMKWPMTHFWEYGQWLDSYKQGEHIRDHLLRAIYGTFSNVKTRDPKAYANLELAWVSYVPAQGEFRRYKGDYVLSETDIRTHKAFPDAVVQNGGAFCLHYPGNSKYDFRLMGWGWDERDGKPYDIPFRCLYSNSISNLMMAGKHISVTHVAGSNTKFMGNGAQHAVATAAAAFLCNKYNTMPRGVCEKHMKELRDLADQVIDTGGPKLASRL